MKNIYTTMDLREILKIATGVALGSIIVGVLTYAYQKHRVKTAIESFNKSMQQIIQQAPREPLVIRAETPEERKLKQEAAKRALENQRYCDFWKQQEDTDRKQEKVKEYCH